MHLTVDKWTVCDLTLSPAKVDLLWKVIRRHQTLFSDLTRNDPDNFLRALTAPHTIWLEVRERDVLVGIIWFGELHQIVDVNAHMAFFDRMSHAKIEVCRAVVKWMFHNFPINRMSVSPPRIYTATIRLMHKLGFTEEGVKRQSILIHGKWHDQILFGITRDEAEAM